MKSKSSSWVSRPENYLLVPKHTIQSSHKKVTEEQDSEHPKDRKKTQQIDLLLRLTDIKFWVILISETRRSQMIKLENYLNLLLVSNLSLNREILMSRDLLNIIQIGIRWIRRILLTGLVQKSVEIWVFLIVTSILAQDTTIIKCQLMVLISRKYQFWSWIILGSRTKKRSRRSKKLLHQAQALIITTQQWA